MKALIPRGPRRSVGESVRAGGVWRGTLIRRRQDGSTFLSSSTVVSLSNDSGTVTHFSVGTASSGAGKILYSGTVTPNIVTGNGVTPQLTTSTQITED